MWTLTIDPTLFSGPEEAFRYVREHRCSAEFVRFLHRHGYLNSPRFFYVVEWHKNGYVHYHLLIDTNYVPHSVARDAWNRFRPVWCAPVQGSRPGFGSVWFSKRDFESSSHAIGYVTKYLVKPPRHPYPEWVMNFNGRIKKYGLSHGFWKQDSHPQNHVGPETAEEKQPEKSPPEVKPRKLLPTIGDRVKHCRESATIYEIDTQLDPDGVERDVYFYYGCPKQSFDELQEKFGHRDGSKKSFPISPFDARRLIERRGNESRGYWPVESDQPKTTDDGLPPVYWEVW
ncbi:MAG: hypothetical protein KDA68_01025 [Planctomycetaceae bacterium]|nr:hypothetical protein [Planctomycetaceae bacterium]